MFFNIRSFFGIFFVLSFVFLSLPSYSDGTCHLITDSNGGYSISCYGDGVEVKYVTVTNESFIVNNCDELKSELSSAVTVLIGDLNTAGSSIFGMQDPIDNSQLILSDMMHDNSNIFEPDVISDLNSLSSYLTQIESSIRDSVSLIQTSISSAEGLQNKIDSVECGSCSGDGEGGSGGDDGSCCDLSEIITLMEQAQSLRQTFYNTVCSFTNYLFSIDSSLHNLLSLTNLVNYVYNPGFTTVSPLPTTRYWRLSFSASSPLSANTHIINSNADVVHSLSTICNNLALSLASFNNYFNFLIFRQLPPALNVVTNDLPSFIDSATNFYAQTLFENTAVLGAFSSIASRGETYHDFLTNYYIRAVSGRISEFGSGDLYKQTNWFARVEALIAALVFSDGGTTNTVGAYHDRFDSVVSGATDLPSSASSRLSVFSETSSGLVSSLRSLGNTFSSVADPGEVVLFNLSDSSGGADDSIAFQSSDIRNFVDVCRNVTTLAWVSVGLIFLFRFIFWTVRTSYSLVVFSWGVLSSIFTH